MKIQKAPRGIGILILAAGLILAALPGEARSDGRWGEFGLSGMALSIDHEFLVWPGGALSLGSWGKRVSFEGYAIFIAYLPIAGGGSLILSPFRTSRVVPYFTAGGIVSASFWGEAPITIVNGGIGLKVPLGARWGLRVEYRLLYTHEDSRWERGGGIFFGLYTRLGRGAGK